MIEINLLPGSGKKKPKGGGGGPKFDLGAALSGFTAKVKDKYLAAAFILLAVGGGAVGASYTMQTKKEVELQSQLDQAVQDSSHYATVMRDKARAEAKRDTVLRQLNIIRSIDEDRFVWAHVLDEVSKALPPYTWLTVVNYSGNPQGALNGPPGPNGVPTPPKPPADSTKKKSKKLETEIPHDTV